MCDRRVGRGRGRGGFGDGQGGWGAGGGTVRSVQTISHTTQVHHAHANHPHAHAARYNHSEQGARVSTRRRKGVDTWPTRSGRRPSADSTIAQTHTSSQPQPKRAVLPQLSLNKHTRTHDDCAFKATQQGPPCSAAPTRTRTEASFGTGRSVILAVCLVCVCRVFNGGACAFSFGHQLHDKTYKVFFSCGASPGRTRCLSPQHGLTALVNW